MYLQKPKPKLNLPKPPKKSLVKTKKQPPPKIKSKHKKEEIPEDDVTPDKSEKMDNVESKEPLEKDPTILLTDIIPANLVPIFQTYVINRQKSVLHKSNINFNY
jgi:hypothetical protein